MPRFQTHFQSIGGYDFLLKGSYQNTFQLPRLIQITLNVSSAHLAQDKKQILPFLLFCELIAGQKGHLTRSKKNKIHMKLKKGMVVGCKATLAPSSSFRFLENLVTLVLPQLKDFHGYTLHSKTPTTLSVVIPNFFALPELVNEYHSFATLPPIHMTLKVQATHDWETALALTTLNFPLHTS